MATLTEWKTEISGKFGGVLKYIDLGIQKPQTIRTRVQKDFYLQDWSNSTVDDKLKWLLEEEYEIYLSQSSNAGPMFIQQTEEFVQRNPGKYPLLESLFPITEVTSDVWAVLSILEGSLSQGRRTRAGGSLESHLEFLLLNYGFRYGADFSTQEEVQGLNKVRLDFLFPANPKYLVSNPNVTVTCACMTTVNDRVRLAIQQLQPNTYRRVPTAHGAKQFGSQMKNLRGRLDYATKNQFRFIVLPDAIDHYENHDTLMTYQEWFDELSSLSSSW